MKLPSFLDFFSNDSEGDEIKIMSNEYMKTSDIAKKLNLGDSNVRKYALALEDNNYYINKDINGVRLFTDFDKESIFQMKQLIEDEGLSVKEASEITADKRIREKYKLEEINKTFESLPPMNYYTILRDEMIAMKTDFVRIENILETAKNAIDSNMELIAKLEALEAANKAKDERILALLKAKSEDLTGDSNF